VTVDSGHLRIQLQEYQQKQDQAAKMLQIESEDENVMLEFEPETTNIESGQIRPLISIERKDGKIIINPGGRNITKVHANLKTEKTKFDSTGTNTTTAIKENTFDSAKLIKSENTATETETVKSEKDKKSKRFPTVAVTIFVVIASVAFLLYKKFNKINIQG